MTSSYHRAYIGCSLAAALIGAVGVAVEVPVLYGYVPGVIGGVCALVASLRFFKHKQDLAGFTATVCGFVFYQAFQANPVTLPEFTQSIATLDAKDTIVGVFLGNFTTGLLLLAYKIVEGLFGVRFTKMLAWRNQSLERDVYDRWVKPGYIVVFVLVALPHVLFGKVVVGAVMNILYQRAAWSSPEEFSGFQVWGGPVGASLVHAALWAPSLFFIWLYLTGSRYKVLVWTTAPLVLLWAASVALQGSRTYLVTLGFGVMVYFLGNPKVGTKSIKYAIVGGVVMMLLLQVSSFFRTSGLLSFNLQELGSRIFEIRGNEGTSSQIDGLEYFRTELVEKDDARNPLLGFVRGIVERPIEGVLMPVPRAIFPLKPYDDSATDFTLFYQNVRCGAPSAVAYMGASPGLVGRELIRYGFLGPITGFFWLGLVLFAAQRFYEIGLVSGFHRIVAAVLISFFVAQMRDWVPMWVLPFLPAMSVFWYAAVKCRRSTRFVAVRGVSSGSEVDGGVWMR